MTEDQLTALINLPKDGVKAALQELKQRYEQADSSLTLMNEADGWKLNVRENYLDLVRKIVSDAELPRALLETLAVIAWKRPILQSEVIRIRSGAAYEHITELEKLGFITKEADGRSYLLKLAPKFFEYFDVKSDQDMKKVFEHVKVPEMPLQSLQTPEAQPQPTDILQRLEEVKKSIVHEPPKPEDLNVFDDELHALSKRVDGHVEELKKYKRIEGEPQPDTTPSPEPTELQGDDEQTQN